MFQKLFIALNVWYFSTEPTLYTDPIKKILKHFISWFLCRRKARLHRPPSLPTNLSSKGASRTSPDKEAWTTSSPPPPTPTALPQVLCLRMGVIHLKMKTLLPSQGKQNPMAHNFYHAAEKKKSTLSFLNKSNAYVFTSAYFTNLHIHGCSFLHPVQVIPQVFYCLTSNWTFPLFLINYESCYRII